MSTTASFLPAREVTFRGSSIEPAPNLPCGCPRDKGDRDPSSQPQECKRWTC